MDIQSPFQQILEIISKDNYSNDIIEKIAKLLDQFKESKPSDEERSELSIRLHRYLRWFYDNCYRCSISADTISKLLPFAPHKRLSKAIEEFGPYYRLTFYNVHELMYLAGSTTGLMYITNSHDEDIIREIINDIKQNTFLQRATRGREFRESMISSIPVSMKIFNKVDSVSNTEFEKMHPHDVVYHIDLNTKRVWLFSRDEFDHIVKTDRNPWTNEVIPAGLVELISQQIKCNDKNLPFLRYMKELEFDKFAAEIINPTTDISTIRELELSWMKEAVDHWEKRGCTRSTECTGPRSPMRLSNRIWTGH